MIEKLKTLKYKHISEFKTEKLRNALETLTANRFKPENSEYYAKIVEMTLAYHMEDGSVIENHISLSIFFLIDESMLQMVDCFCAPTFPLEFRVTQDLNALNNLFEIYQNDLKEIKKHEQKSEGIA